MIASEAISLVFKSLDIRDLALSRSVTKRYDYLRARLGGAEILHALANLLLKNRLRICLETIPCTPISFYKGIELCYDVRSSRICSAVVKRFNEKCYGVDITDEVVEKLRKVIPFYPRIAVDTTLIDLHSEEEKNELLKQLVLLLDVVERYLTCEHIDIINPTSELLHRLELAAGYTPRVLCDEDVVEAYQGLNILLLDPYAEEELKIEDVQACDVIVVGGLIDEKFPRPYATSTLYRIITGRGLKVARRSIRLWGSTIGVPNRINRIIEIVLRSRIYGEDIEDLIIEYMNREDRIVRFMSELKKMIDRNTVDRDSVQKLIKILRIDYDTALQICRRLLGERAYHICGGGM